MYRRTFLLVGFAVIASLGASAFAFVNEPSLIPGQPYAGEPVSFAITTGFCDLLLGTEETHREDNHIYAVIDGVRAEALCAYPTIDSVFDIGTFAPGTYTLQVDYSYFYPGAPNDISVETVGTIQFDVAPSSDSVATSVPGLNAAGKIGLLIVLALISFVALRRHTRQE